MSDHGAGQAGRRLRYRRASEEWLDGLPLGNGLLGAMVLAGPTWVRLQLNDATAWSGGTGSEHRRPAVTVEQAAAARRRALGLFREGRHVAAQRELAVLQGHYAQAYLPFADVRIELTGGAADGDVGGTASGGGTSGCAGGGAAIERELVLRDATHHVRVDGGRLIHETAVSAPRGVLLHRLRCERPVDVRLRLSSPLPTTSRAAGDDRVAVALRLPADVAPGHEPNEPPVTWRLDTVEPLAGAVVLGWRHDGAVWWVSGADRVLDEANRDVDEAGQGIDEAGPAVDRRADGDVVLTGVRRLDLAVATGTTSGGLGRGPTCAAPAVLAACSARVDAALGEPVEALLAEHRTAHRALFDRVGLDLGAPGPAAELDTDRRVLAAAQSPGGPLRADPDLVALAFDYGRYLLVSSMRPGGRPATLQGLWNEQMQAPWSSAYTLNINTQMNHWPIGPLGLDECAEPLLELAEQLADRGRATARRLYGARGWVAHHNTDAWAFTSPTAGDASWALWPMAGPWLVRQLDERRRFGAADDAWLRRLWLLAVGAAEASLDLLVADGADDDGDGDGADDDGDDRAGGLGTWPSTSPENRFATPDGPATVTIGSGMDRALFRELAATVRALAPLVGEPRHPVLAELAAAEPRVAPPRVTLRGDVAEWHDGAVAVDPHHRHVSHLVFAYPGDGPGPLVDAVARSLDLRGDDSTGWSLAWKLALRARLGQRERVAGLLRLALRPAWGPEAAARGPHAGGLYRNLFAAHPPYQLDGNLGLVAGIAELLVQSHAGVVDLLPALPAELPDGAVRGLVARPGLVVDLRWRDGTPTRVALRARTPAAAGRHTVRSGALSRTVTVPTDTTVVLRWREDSTPTTTDPHEQE